MIKKIIIGSCILLLLLFSVSSQLIISKPKLTGKLVDDSKNYLDYKYDMYSLDKTSLTVTKTFTNKKYVVIQFRDKEGNIRNLITKKENIIQKI